MTYVTPEDWLVLVGAAVSLFAMCPIIFRRA